MTQNFRQELQKLFRSEGGSGNYVQFEQSFLQGIQAFEKTQTQAPPQPVTHPTQKIPVLLVPGYAEPSWYFMYGIYQTLKREGWPVEGINLFPNFAPAEEQALKVKAKAEAMLKKYGTAQIHLVVHSFGGLISRYYIQALGGKTVVKQLITIATPHLGTYSAYLGPGQSAVQLRPESSFLKALNQNGFVYPPTRYSSIWTNWDEIVLPPKHAQMPDAPQHYVPNRGHLTIMFSEKTYQAILQELKAD